MSLLGNLLGNRRKKQARKASAQLATKADLEALRKELKETPEDKENLEFYKRWQSLKPKERREKWERLTIKQRNRLSHIVAEYKKKGVVK